MSSLSSHLRMLSDKYSLKMVCSDRSRHPRDQDCSVRASLRHSLVSHSRSSSSGNHYKVRWASVAKHSNQVSSVKGWLALNRKEDPIF